MSSQNTYNVREARLCRHNNGDVIETNLRGNWQNQKIKLRFYILLIIIQLTQFCVSYIHIPSSLRKGIKLGIPVVPACTVHHKYLDDCQIVKLLLTGND